MAVSFSIPKSPARSILTVDSFLGADFTNSAASVDETKSPNTINMIRDVPGKVRKSMGWEVVDQFGGKEETKEEATHQVIENSMISTPLTEVTMTSKVYLKDDMYTLEPQNVVVNMTDYIGKQKRTYTIENTAFEIEGDTYKSNGFWGISDGVNEFTDHIDFETGTITKKIMFDTATNELITSVVDSLELGTKLNIITKQSLNRRYNGTVWKTEDGYNFDMTNTRGIYWEVRNAVDLSRIPIPEDMEIYFFADGLSEDMSITLPSLNAFILYSRQTTIDSDNPIGFTCEVVDTENLKQINGFHRMRGDDKGLIHAGTDIYRDGELLYSDANDARSKSWQFEDRLYILDGKKLLVFYSEEEEVEGETVTTYHVEKVEDNAYIPTLTISKEPGGGGTSYEDLNLLTPAFTEMFLGQTGVKDYVMSFNGLDDTIPKVEVMNSNGDFIEKRYGTDFTYNARDGIITFVTAPGPSPLTGEDNVKITAYRTLEGYADRINKCTIGTLFGVNGALDRLFVSGNPDYINYDWYSGQYDPTYFTDTSYSMLGSSASAIMGYSVISNYLAAHKDFMERDQNIILREGDLVDNEPSFRIVNTLQGAGALSKYSFAYLQTEPLFLTNLGIYAVTAQDITGEKYAQNRSYFLDGKLMEEENLEDSYGFVYKDMYWLCLNDVAYILDGLQPIQTDKNKPYATRQYVGYYRNNLPARVMWEQDNVLYFGTPDGRICRFHTDKYASESYNDNGSPIEAIWETPDIDGKLFYKNKTLRYIALRLDSAIATSVSIYVMNRGLWQFIKKDDTSGRYLSFAHLIFSKVSFSGDKTQHTFSTKVRVKKVDKFRLRVVNDDLNEPFGLFDMAFEYVENGNYKG